MINSTEFFAAECNEFVDFLYELEIKYPVIKKEIEEFMNKRTRAALQEIKNHLEEIRIKIIKDD